MAPFGAAQESCRSIAASRGVVGPGRLELPTLRLSGVRSNHLSYGPMAASPDQVTLGLAIESLALAANDDWKEKRRRRHPA
jgi:hypothetical protein